MKIGVNTFLFASPFTDANIDSFKTIKEMGFDGVELSYENVGDFDPKRIGKAIADNGLECSTICGAYGPGRDLRGTDEEQATSKQYRKDCIDACVDAGAKVYAGPHYSRVGRSAMETSDERKRQWDLVVNNFKEVCAYAEDKGVTIAVEPLNRFETDFLNICSDAIRLIKEVDSPAIKIHLDTFHMNIEEKSMAEAIINAGDLCAHIHASESDRGAPGTGLVDWKLVRDSLKLINYQGWVVIESFTPEVEIIARAASIYRETEKSSADLCIKGLNFLRALFAK